MLLLVHTCHSQSPCYSILRLSDESGKMEFTLVSESNLARSSLDSKDGECFQACIVVVMNFGSHYLCCLYSVFIADTGKAVYVWIGSGASKDEKKQAMSYAHVRNIRISSKYYMCRRVY